LKLKWEGTKSLLREFVVAGGIAFLLVIPAILPGIGYIGGAYVHVKQKTALGFWLVDADCNVSLNPFIYSLSWMTGRGQYSASFSICSVPTYVGSGSFKYPVWRSQSELEDEAIITLILREIPLNVFCDFVILLAIGLVKRRELYVCLAGGIIGFPFGGPIGAFIIFFCGVLAMFWILPKLRRSGALTRIWESKQETAEFQS